VSLEAYGLKGRLSKISECKTFVEVREGIYDDGIAVGEHRGIFTYRNRVLGW